MIAPRARPPLGRSPAMGGMISTPVASIRTMADAASLDERLEQIGAQLDWVRDYL